MYAAGVRGAGSVCESGMGDRMFYHTPPLRSAMTAVTGRCYVRTDRAPRRAGSPKPYNCRRTFRTAHDPTLSFWIVRRNPDGGFLCAGAAQSLVRPGLRRGLHPRLHLRLSPGSVALRAGRGGMVANRCAPLVVAAPCPGGPHPLRPGLPVRLSARAAFKPAFSLSGNVQIRLVPGVPTQARFWLEWEGSDSARSPGLRHAFALEIERHGSADQILQGRLIDFVAFVDVNGAPHIPFEAGVE